MIVGCALSPRAWTLRQRGYDRSGVKWRLKQIRYGLGELPSGSNIGWELPDVRRMRTAASWLGRHLQLACTLVSVIVITVAAGSAPGTAQGYSAAQLETVHPRHGIGVVFSESLDAACTMPWAPAIGSRTVPTPGPTTTAQAG